MEHWQRSLKTSTNRVTLSCSYDHAEFERSPTQVAQPDGIVTKTGNYLMYHLCEFEKGCYLNLRGHKAEHIVDLVLEPTRQHLVGLIQDEHLDVGRICTHNNFHQLSFRFIQGSLIINNPQVPW